MEINSQQTNFATEFSTYARQATILTDVAAVNHNSELLKHKIHLAWSTEDLSRLGSSHVTTY